MGLTMAWRKPGVCFSSTAIPSKNNRGDFAIVIQVQNIIQHRPRNEQPAIHV
jgi:hypothetical protein